MTSAPPRGLRSWLLFRFILYSATMAQAGRVPSAPVLIPPPLPSNFSQSDTCKQRKRRKRPVHLNIAVADRIMYRTLYRTEYRTVYRTVYRTLPTLRDPTSPLPAPADRVAHDALVGGMEQLGQAEERNPPLFIFEGGHLCAAVHGAGVNLRYLPAVSEVTSATWTAPMMPYLDAGSKAPGNVCCEGIITVLLRS